MISFGKRIRLRAEKPKPKMAENCHCHRRPIGSSCVGKPIAGVFRPAGKTARLTGPPAPAGPMILAGLLVAELRPGDPETGTSPVMDRGHFARCYGSRPFCWAPEIMDRGHFAECYGSRSFCRPRVLWIEVILLRIDREFSGAAGDHHPVRLTASNHARAVRLTNSVNLLRLTNRSLRLTAC